MRLDLLTPIVLALLTTPVAADAAPAFPGLGALDESIIRHAAFDFCLPATAQEYESLGKNGVLKVDADSVIATELPIARVYLEVFGLKIPLRRIAVFDPIEDNSRTASGQSYTRQTSFYLVPINVLKKAPKLRVDFTGGRIGFGLGTLKLDDGAPGFARLDEYDTPGEPNVEALREILIREYPRDFSN